MRLARPLACAVTVLVVAASTEALASPTVPAASDATVVLVATVAPGSSVAGVADRADAGDTDVRHVLAPLRRVSVAVPADEVADEARRLDALPGVTAVTRVARRYVTAEPNDSYFTLQQNYLDAVAVPAAWNVTHGSRSVKIGIVDTGVDATHPDLDGKIVGTYNAVDGGTSVVDRVGHGTFVAGVAAAETGNGIGVAGVGYDASLLVAKVSRFDRDDPDGNYSISADDEARGIIWAVDHGAKIVNISLGASTPDPTEQDAVEYAQRKGALVVAAAGNEGTPGAGYPAAYPDVVGVGATDVATGSRAEFSNYGLNVDLGAPGTNIYSTTVRQGSAFWPARSYDIADGTSFSSPLVAGAAALLLGRFPTATAAQLQDALVSTAHGYSTSLLGTGQVDVAAAMTALDTAIAPSLSGTSGSGSTFYPYRDGYRDTFTPTTTVNRPSTLTLEIRNAAGATVRTVSASRPAGTTGLPWSGTDSAGRAVPAGAYSYRYLATDPAGRQAVGPTGSVTVSPKRLVTLSATLTRRGSQLSRSVRDASCARVTTSKLGRRLVNSCVPGRTRTVQAAYRFTLPAATTYTSLTASVRGRSPSQPARITGRVTRTAGGSTATASRTVRSTKVKTYSLGSVAAAGHLRGRTAELLVGVTNRYTKRGNPSDLDIGRVTLRVTYRVLR